MGNWETVANGENIDINKYLDFREYATTTLRDTASASFGSGELFHICRVIETGYYYYWNGAAWARFPAAGGAGAPTDASYVTIYAEGGLSAETQHANITGANLHVTKAHETEHESGGSQEIDVTDLSGVLADEQDAGKIKGKTIDTTGLADNDILQYDLASTTWKPETLAGGGDMTKAVYDANDDGVVEDSDKLEANTLAQVQDHTPKLHKASHVTGADKLVVTDLLEAIARTTVRKNTGANVGSRRRLNLIEGSGVSLNVTDDAANEEVDVNISTTGGTSYRLAPDYTIYQVGSYYYAMDSEGNIDYSSTNPLTVVQNAQNNLSTTNGGTIWIQSSFTATGELVIDRPGVSIMSGKHHVQLVKDQGAPYFYSIMLDANDRSLRDIYLQGLAFDQLELYARNSHYVAGVRVEDFHCTPYAIADRRGIIFRSDATGGYPEYIDNVRFGPGRFWIDSQIDSDTTGFGCITFRSPCAEAAAITFDDIYIYGDGGAGPLDVVRFQHGSVQGAGSLYFKRMHLAIQNFETCRIFHIEGGSTTDTRGSLSLINSYWECHQAGHVYTLVDIDAHTGTADVGFRFFINNISMSMAAGTHYVIQNANSNWSGYCRAYFGNIYCRGSGLSLGTKGTESDNWRVKLENVQNGNSWLDEDW